jgi:asparagine synthase (glutamine-hydrolysing)
VALDGHLHNREELSTTLEGRNYAGDLSSDAALVLGAYLEFGVAGFDRFRGTWALVVWDERERRLFVARDPLGVRPLYYHWGSRFLVLASEIKSILALDDDARAIDHRSVSDILCARRIDDWTRTCFSRIKPVPPGTSVELSSRESTPRRFWTLRPCTNKALTPADIREALIRAVDRHTSTSGRIGLALSGGIDSSSLAGILAQSSLRGTRDVHAFSVKPPDTADESALVDATVRDMGIPHSHVPLDAVDYPRELSRLIDLHDEPIQYSGVFYQFVLRQHMAEAGCDSVLVGYGADEIFAGYKHLMPPFAAALVAYGRWRDFARLRRGATDFFGDGPRGTFWEVYRYVQMRAKASLYDSIKRAIDYRKVRNGQSSFEPRIDVLAPADGAHDGRTTSEISEFDLRGLDHKHLFFTALLECFRENMALLVRLEDRNAMAHGLELCAPFMDEELVQTALAFPFHRYMEGGRNKAILRDAMQEFLVPEVKAFRKKLATPGSDAYVAFEALRTELPDLLNSLSFRQSGLWSPRCFELYQSDAPRKRRGDVWFCLYVVQKWYEQVVRPS